MNEEPIVSELLTSEGEIPQLIAALAKASKEHDRFITITITIASGEPQVEVDGP